MFGLRCGQAGSHLVYHVSLDTTTTVIVNFVVTHLCVMIETGCETMGGSNEFFDKFSVRYHVSVILKQLWEHPIHHATIVAESANTQDNADFIRFINMLINDTTFLLDESLDSLKSIHETQEAQNDRDTWTTQPRVSVGFGNEGKGRSGCLLCLVYFIKVNDEG